MRSNLAPVPVVANIITSDKMAPNGSLSSRIAFDRTNAEARGRPLSPCPRICGFGVNAVHSFEHCDGSTPVRNRLGATPQNTPTGLDLLTRQLEHVSNVLLNRVDSRMNTLQGFQPNVDRRLAELSGSCKGLFDEMQAQIRRIDSIEFRLWEWHQQFEEDIQVKFTEAQRDIQQMSTAISSVNASQEESLKRHYKKMQVVEQQLASREVAGDDIVNLHQRVTEVEEQTSELAAISQGSISLDRREIHVDSLTSMEAQLANACQKIEFLYNEVHDVHERLEVQEERMKVLRTLCEKEEVHNRFLTERVEGGDWDRRLKVLQSHLDGLSQERNEQSDTVKILQNKFTAMEQSQEDLFQLLQRIQHWLTGIPLGDESILEKDSELVQLDAVQDVYNIK